MSWMGAIAIDGGILVEDLARAGIADPYDGSAAETARSSGWVSPTEAWLANQLLDDIVEGGTLNTESTALINRIKGILGHGEGA